jgi:hypothetical protein
MEEDIQLRQVSPVAASIEKVEERLEAAIEKATYRINYESAHNEELINALSIVENFIRRKKRVCYGGTAMNAILPEERRFYNSDTDLPDYDYYTPELDADVDELVADMKKAGFKEVYHKVGMHEGTKKILVNFVPVADITAISPELFAIMYRRSVVRDGVHYTDPDMLRMMMYLEISRPFGMPERWKKVFERLQLINHEFPIDADCRRGVEKRQHHLNQVDIKIRKNILDYCVDKGRILCNGPLALIYEKGIRRGKAKFEIRPGGPLLFTSPDPKSDVVSIQKIIGNEGIKIYLHRQRGEIVPERVELRMENKPICMFIKESACHAYNPIPMKDGRKINVASLELLITLYLSIEIFTNHSQDYLGESIICQVKKFIDLSQENYKANKSMFPAFSVECQGHQVGYASLLKAKVARIKKERKKETKKGRQSHSRASSSGTRRVSKSGAKQ